MFIALSVLLALACLAPGLRYRLAAALTAVTRDRCFAASQERPRSA